MKIAGLQKLTLLDYPGKVACSMFTPGCNYRCPFCHNAALVLPERPRGEIHGGDVLAFLRKRVGMLDGVCVSGGEPLLQAGLTDFLREVKALGYAVKLDTNGSNPALLGLLIDEGLLDYAAMDIKNNLSKYCETAGVPGLDLDTVVQSAELLMQERIPFEFRTTLVREFHTREDVLEIGRWLQGAPRYFLQHFVDSGDLLSGGLHPVEEDEMRVMADILRSYVKEVELRGI
ncbi:MAG: anaerobic ribonucleoside-triphosphate reductase activating protein [Christensenellales bacterium]|jgi:pyruvate formate lyase activating enzyme|nr:anaerobic ribonucleoside-triphosphate reductase activating protein [Bacteroidales bacterium]